jgi:enoyl-CoA hydratase
MQLMGRGDAPVPYRFLIFKESDDLARITLNRPEKRNALSIELSDELVDAIEQVRRSDTIRFLVIDGAGDTFCAGDDIPQMTEWGNTNQAMRRVRYYQNMANQLEELDKLTIAAVDGYAVGGGLEITMACDFVIATERAVWGMPEIDSGLTPGWGGTTRMARLIGRRLTKEINILGALHPARRAVAGGLWNRVVATGELFREVERLLALLRSKNQQAARQMKFMINRGVECDLYTAQGFEAFGAALSAAVNRAGDVPDCDNTAGIAAFATKSDLWTRRRALARDFWSD